MSRQTAIPTLVLNSGRAIPQVGLGVWQAPAGGTAEQAVLAALQAGYRHIDSAQIYGNEADMGEGIRRSGIPREEIFVTTNCGIKIRGTSARRAFDASLKRLGLSRPISSRSRHFRRARCASSLKISQSPVTPRW